MDFMRVDPWMMQLSVNVVSKLNHPGPLPRSDIREFKMALAEAV